MDYLDFNFLDGKAEELQKFLSKDFTDISEDELMKELNESLLDLEEEFKNNETKLTLPFKKVHADTLDPKYNYGGDSGFDLYSTEDILLQPFGRALVPTGLSFDIKDGYEIQVRSKSGLAINQGLMCLNSPGTVDCFSEDMKILTVNGEKTIKELNINDIVFSFNEKTLEIEKDVIVHIFNTEEQEIIIFETDEGILEVTPNSEIYTKNGLKLAKELKENDEIIIF